MPGLTDAREGFVGEGEFGGGGGVQEEGELLELAHDEVAVAGGLVAAELEDGVVVRVVGGEAAVDGGEDVGDGEDSVEGGGDVRVGPCDPDGEVAAGGEAAVGEHGGTCGDEVFGFGSGSFGCVHFAML